MKERRPCVLIAADRTMIRYRLHPLPDIKLRAYPRELANRYRFGDRRMLIMLRREDEPSRINRVYRFYREDGTARKRRAQRRAVGTHMPILVEAKVNTRWPVCLSRANRHIDRSRSNCYWVEVQ